MSGSVLDKLKKLLSKDTREQSDKKDKLRKILAKMRKKQKTLEEKLSEQSDPELQEELRKKIRMLKEQRRKGLAHLGTLRQPKVE